MPLTSRVLDTLPVRVLDMAYLRRIPLSPAAVLLLYAQEELSPARGVMPENAYKAPRDTYSRYPAPRR